MSGTISTPTASAQPRNWTMIGAIVVSAICSLTFWAALVVAYLAKDQSQLQLLIGAVVANSTTVIGYWVGSSSGSSHKSDLLAAVPVAPVAAPAPVVTPPVAQGATP